MKKMSFNDFAIDVDTSILLKAGKKVPLGPRPFEVLLYMLENRGRVVTKQELFEQIWGNDFVTDAALTQVIKEIRSALGDDARSPRYVRTVHRKGYQFIAPLSDGARVVKRRWRMLRLALGLSVVGFLILAVSLWVKSTEPRYLPNSIVVLPFINMSDDAGNEYFSDGISEELLILLAQIPELHVISRSSAFSFKGKHIDIPTIAAQLNVVHVLEGSVRKSGNRVRITVQLIDAHSDTHLWSETYDRTLDDIFAIQNEIATKVVAQLKITMLGDVPETEETDPEVYVLYLQARHLGRRGTSGAWDQSTALYQRALAIDPNYATAWSGLTDIYLNQTGWGLRSLDEGWTLVRETANQALAIDPDCAPAHAILGSVAFFYEFDLEAAARHLEHALALEPTNPEILSRGADLVAKLGLLDEAIAISEYIVNRDPVNPVYHESLGRYYLRAGRLDEAIASFRTALTLSPGYRAARYRIGMALLYKGELQAALVEMQQEQFPSKQQEGEAIAYHALGHQAESDALLVELIDKDEYGGAYNIAYVLAFRGEADRAFAWLDKAVRRKDTGLTLITIQPEFDNIHEDPRWLPFLESIGMSPEQLAAIEFKVTLPE